MMQEKPHSRDFVLLHKFIGSSADDRTVAVVCAAYCEKYLGEMLRRRLIGVTGMVQKKIFSHSGVLGTFGARIDIAQALGNIDTSMAACLRDISKIRNKFAHELTVSSFEEPYIRKIIEKFPPGQIVGGSPEIQEESDRRYYSLALRDRFAFHATSAAMSLHNWHIQLDGVDLVGNGN